MDCCWFKRFLKRPNIASSEKHTKRFTERNMGGAKGSAGSTVWSSPVAAFLVSFSLTEGGTKKHPGDLIPHCLQSASDSYPFERCKGNHDKLLFWGGFVREGGLKLCCLRLFKSEKPILHRMEREDYLDQWTL
jgi:hypothetical protein